ncbi:MAG: phosphonate C-P lyase system protein PhnH [Bauldia sp.]|nr:phosphonate C-P lyase system protein PhnH [Bauldia sp.]
MISEAGLSGGFEVPVLGAQAAFRALLAALSEPGTIVPLTDMAEPPAPLGAAAGTILATLADHDAAVFLDERLRVKDVADWIAFHTGAPLTADAALASFAVLSAPGTVPLAAFAEGSHDYPDRSTTVIVQVPALGGETAVRLTGPGIKTAREIALPVASGWLAEWRANHARFPLGVDVVFVAGETLLGLPRTTRIGGI